LNKSTVTAIASQIDTLLPGTVDKLRLISLSAVSESEDQKRILQQALDEDPILIAANIYQMSNVSPDSKIYYSISQEKFNKAYDLAPDFFTTQLLQNKNIPFENIIRKNKIKYQKKQKIILLLK
jgi:hypothetical protein